MSDDPLTIWTIGHSNRSWDEFVALLSAHGIEAIADVRRFAGSRKHPQFGAAALEAALHAIGIGFVAFPELGGRRRPRPDSPNGVWRNESFRGYADHMASAEFLSGIERLLPLAEAQRTALMCSEAVWWRCHRSMIADHLKSLGVRVCHIMDRRHAPEHPYTSAARLEHGRLSYAAGEPAAAA